MGTGRRTTLRDGERSAPAGRSRAALVAAAWLLAGVVGACFLQPWVRVESRAATAVRKWLGGTGQGDLVLLRGYEVPRAASGPAGAVVLAASGIPWARAQARAAWAVPALAVLLACASLAATRSRRAALGVGFGGAAVFLAMLVRIVTAPRESLGARIHFEPALWLTLACFLLFAAVGGALGRPGR